MKELIHNLVEVTVRSVARSRRFVELRLIACFIAVALTGTAAQAEYAFVRSIGSYGTGDGQFQWVQDLAVDSSGNVFVVGESNCRIQEFTSTGSFVRAFGGTGSGDGQIGNPGGVAVDASGNVFVSDSYYNRIVVFDSSGSFVRAFGTAGSGDGQLNHPYGLAMDPSGNVWVADSSNHRVQEFTNTGTFLQAFGSEGAGNGQFGITADVTIDSSGNVWAADPLNFRVQQFSPTGEFIQEISPDLGQGPSYINGVAVDLSGKVFVADSLNDRIEVFSSSGQFIEEFWCSGTGDGQSNVDNDITYVIHGVAVDARGNVWVADAYYNYDSRVQQFVFVPEPSTFCLLAVGGVSLFCFRWRRRQRRVSGTA